MTTCAVCLDACEGSDAARLPGCGHVFHVACALTFAQYDLRCPVCRALPHGATPRPPAPQAATIIVQWDGVEELEGEEDEEEGEERRERARYARRRRRVLHRRPDLMRLYNDLKGVRGDMERTYRQLRVIYELRCREAWRDDPDVRTHRATYARLRRRQRRTERRLYDALAEEMGPEPE